MALTKVTGDFIKDGVLTVGHLHTSHGITTAHIGEGSNLYFTNARVDSRIGDLSTSNLSEGTNLYYTQARFNTAFAAKSTSDLSEGTNLYYTDARVGSYLTTNSYATQSYVNTQVSNLVDSAPSTLDTLNELAAALGDDANFSTTVTNSIATKLPLAGGTLTGDLTLDDGSGASPAIIFKNANDETWEITHGSQGVLNFTEGTDHRLRLLQGGDATFAGAVTIDQDGDALNLRSITNAVKPRITFSSDVPAVQIGHIEYTHANDDSYGSAEAFIIGGTESTMTVLADGKLMYNEGIYSKPASGTGAGTRKDSNWDTAYGWGDHAGAGYLTSLPSHNHDDRYYTETETNNLLANKTDLNHVRSLGTTAFTGTATTAGFISEIESDGAFDSYTSFFKHSWSYSGNDNLADAGRFTETAGASFITWTDNASDSTRGNITVLAIAPNTGGSAGKVFIYNDQGSGYGPGWREVWCNTSDGSGSGLDADLLDGQHASAFQPAGSYMTLSGDQSISGTKTFSNSSIVIAGSSGTISFLDTTSGQDDFYIHVNSNNFYVLTDRDGGNEVDAGYEAPHPLQLEADTNIAYTFGNRILTTADEGSGNGIDADTVDGLQAGSFLRSDADDTFTGKLIVGSSGSRRAGMYGIYNSSLIGHIWSMGTAYHIPQNGANFGNLYGLAYKHTNNTTGGTMAGGHQMVWCSNGTAQSAIGTNIWTNGIIDADGATFGGTVSMNGQTLAMGNGTINGINHLALNDPGVNEGLQWVGGNNWYIQECPDAMTNASGNLQFSTGTTRRFTINTSGYVYAERYYDMGSTSYYLDPGGTSNLNAATFAGDITVNGNQIYTLGGNADVKFSVWDSITYGIGMTSGVTLGHLNDYAMTFCMNNDTDRGFWWGYSGQSKSAGAMALTTNGLLTVTNRVVAPNYYVDGYIYHNGDTNTYIRMIAADDMQLVAGGRQMLRMDEGTDPDKLRFVTDSNWTNSSGEWAMSGNITVQAAVYSNDGIVYDKDDSSAYYRATGTSTPHGDIYFQSTNRIWWNSQTTSSNYLAIQGGVSSGAYIDFNATGSTKKIHWRQFGTHTRFTMDMSSAAFVAMGPVSANGSDLRLKENIVTIDGALAKVKAMRGVYYNRIDLDTGRRRVGVIAQEIETVLPEVVDQVGQLAQHPECDDDEIRAVSYGNISAVLIEAIKEQQTIIDDLKARLETLENQ